MRQSLLSIVHLPHLDFHDSYLLLERKDIHSMSLFYNKYPPKYKSTEIEHETGYTFDLIEAHDFMVMYREHVFLVPAVFKSRP